MEYISEHEIYLNEYITGNRFIDICDDVGATFCKPDYLPEFKDLTCNAFVTHNSDYPIDERFFTFRPKNYKVWFAQNKVIDDNSIKGIPIGLENMILRISHQSAAGRFSSQVKNALEKAKFINGLAKKKYEHDKLIYLNINPRTYPSERQYIIDKFGMEKWVTKENNVSWEDFYSQIGTHKFVFSPRGNGIDCHRTWEALYLRTIPIVKESVTMNEFKDLPILFVKNWDEISYNYLNEKYEEIISTKYNLDKLMITHWREVIQKTINE